MRMRSGSVSGLVDNTPAVSHRAARYSTDELSQRTPMTELTTEQFAVCRLKATEVPFSGAYYHETRAGTYCCVCCGQALFRSEAKYASGSGWPSFWQSEPNAVAKQPDYSHGMQRIEIVCSACQAHLGHVFDDGPAPTGRRYCVNSIALDLKLDQP